MSTAGDRVSAPLDQLIGRLVAAARSAIASGNLDQARATAEDVQLVDPDNREVAAILAEVIRRERSPGQERALMTIFFSDLVDSTALAGRLEPEAMQDLYGIYRDEAKQAIDRFGGHILQFLGDGVMASFGYPAAHEDDARRAVHAGLALIKGLDAAGAAANARHGAEPKARVGIHTGLVVVAGLGARDYRERDSIVGVAPNLAARLQSEADPGMVVVSDVTKALVEGQFELRSLGLRQLKGIARTVEVFSVERMRSAFGQLDASRARRAGLHGRDEARTQLVRAWGDVNRAGAGPGRVALISGEAGIGKTRLAAEMRHIVAEDDANTFAAACQPYYANISLWPISVMIERAMNMTGVPDDARVGILVDRLTAAGVDTSTTVPLLAPLIGIDDPPGFTSQTLDPTTRLQETLAAIIDWLAHLAADHPLLFVVEDLHWSDPTTLGLLGLLASAPPTGLLTIATTRDASALPWKDQTLYLALGRLDDETTAGLVDELAGDSDLPAEVRRSIIERADGIPLFAVELTGAAVHENLSSSEPLPYRLQELMTGRLKTPGIDLRLAQLAATIGADFDRDLLARVTGDGYDIDPELVAMQDAGIIDLVLSGDQPAFRFRHALMRDAAYETQVLEVRRNTHAAVADVLEADEADSALLAHHLDLADQPVSATSYYIAGGQAAEARGAHPEAIRLLTRAIELIERLPESEERDLTELTARMLRALNVSSMQGYASADVATDHQRVEILTKQLGARPEVVPSLIGIWAYWLISGDHDTAQRVIGRVERLVEDPALAVYRPEALACAGFQSLFYDTLDHARIKLEQAIETFAARTEAEEQAIFWPLPNDAVAATAIALATIAALQGDLGSAASWERRAYDRVDAIGAVRGPFSRGFVNVYAAFIRRIANDDQSARVLGADTAAIGREHGYVYWVMVGTMYQVAPTLEADPDPAFLAGTIDAIRGIGHHAFIASNLAYLAELRAEAGDLAGALDTIDDALVTVDKTGEGLHRPELLRRRVWYRRELVGPGPSDVRELIEAFDAAVAKDIHVFALRAAINLARLPDDERPADWRARLDEARGRLPADSTALEATRADAILAA